MGDTQQPQPAGTGAAGTGAAAELAEIQRRKNRSSRPCSYQSGTGG